MGQLLPCFRCIVIVCNVLFIVVALALIAGGFILKLGNKYVDDQFDKTLDSIRESVKDIYGQESADKITSDELDLAALFHPAIVFLLTSGFFLLVLCSAGLIGACFQIKCLLLLYASVILVMAAGQIIFISLLFGKPDVIKKAVKVPLNDLLEEFRGLNGTNAQSISWNFVMQELSCCGVDDYTDFANSQWVLKGQHLTPWACCKELPKNLMEADNCAGSSGTASTSTIDGLNNYDQGCVDKVYDKLIKDNKVYIGLVAFFVFVLQVVLVVFTCVIANDDGKKVHPAPNKRRASRHAATAANW